MLSFLKIKISQNRIYGLDILRAFAIFFVVLDHSKHTLQNSHSELISKISEYYSWYLRYIVFDGVSIFFVLSGFLIGSILIKSFDQGDLSLKNLFNFWIKRWMRTLPNYVFILSLLICLSSIFDKSFNAYIAWPYYVFLQNFSTPHPGFFPEAWSLSIEEWFYLLIPPLILLFSFIFKLSFRTSFIIVAISVLVFSTLNRFYCDYFGLINSHDDWSDLLRKQVITRLDSLMFGLIGSYIFYFKNDLWSKQAKPLFIIGLVILLSSKYIPFLSKTELTLYENVFSFSITSFSVLLLLPFLECLKTGNGFIYRMFTYTSLISYSMYLLNLSVIQDWILNPLANYITDNNTLALTKFILFWILTYLLSLTLYKFIELPFMNLRKKIIFK